MTCECHMKRREGFSWAEFWASLISTGVSACLILYAYELQSNPSTTPPFTTWLSKGVASWTMQLKRWIPRVVIPAVVSMVLPEGRGPADEEEDQVIAEWRSKTGDPAKIDQTDDRIYRRVWLTCPSCSGRQPEYIVQGAATRVMRCKACQRVVWTKSPS